MRRGSALAVAGLAAILPTAGSAQPPAVPAVVHVAEGALRGERLTDGRVLFRGIPFAAPPVGSRRWRPPAPPHRWRGVRDARSSAPSCPQPDQGWNAANARASAEDCLYLEVGTPDLTPARPLPVMVWIHGGSNVAGGAPGTIAAPIVHRGIVLVSIQYRLGPLGFMAHRALTAEAPGHASGNYGLMDQQAALRWVRRNIARFGGDPRNVTIFGGSAGGQDVGLQQVSPLAAGLFDKAIEQSGTAGFGWAPRSLAASEAIGEVIATGAGAPHAGVAALRALPVARLLAAAAAMPPPPGLPDAGTAWLQTTIDGHVITEPPAVTLARGGGQRVPLILGANAREIAFYPDAASARTAMAAAYGAATTPALYGPDTADTRLAIATDLVFGCPAMLVARWRADAGVPVWRYRLSYAAPGDPPVTHGSDLRLVLDGAGRNGVPADAPALQAHWVAFARTGDPNVPGLPVWHPAGPEAAAAQFGPPPDPARTRAEAAACRHARYP